MAMLLRRCLVELNALPLDDKFSSQTPAFREIQRAREKLNVILSTSLAGITNEQVHALVSQLSLVAMRFSCGSNEDVLEAAREANMMVRLAGYLLEPVECVC